MLKDINIKTLQMNELKTHTVETTTFFYLIKLYGDHVIGLASL